MCRSAMRRSAWVVLLLVAGGVARGTPPVEEEPPDAQARAVAALPNAQILALAPEPAHAIVGLSRAIEGSAQDIQGAMRDLHAKVIGQEIHIELSADVLFDFDKADIRPDAEAQLAKAALIIRGESGATVRAEGHTDSKGTHDYNLKLSEQRARAVVAWFQAHADLAATHFEARGFAETRPVAPNTKPDGADDPDGRRKNRRVEIVVKRQ